MDDKNTMLRNFTQAIVLGAGKGSRFETDEPIPKVLQQVAGKPMIRWVVDACRQAGVTRIIVVVGYMADKLRNEFEQSTDIVFVEQKEQLGTGHAAMMAEDYFANSDPTRVIVLGGDAPLIRPSTLGELIATHESSDAVATLATAILDDPTGYGRIMRTDDGAFEAIIEHKDCTNQQRLIREINPAYYCFNSDSLFAALHRVKNDNTQGEYYLTDVPGLLKNEGEKISVVDAVAQEDVLGVNTPEQWKMVDDILRRRLIRLVGEGQAG